MTWTPSDSDSPKFSASTSSFFAMRPATPRKALSSMHSERRTTRSASTVSSSAAAPGCSRTKRRKSRRSSTTSSLGSSATTVAVRWPPISSGSSPITSPASSRFNTTSSPSTEVEVTFRRPLEHDVDLRRHVALVAELLADGDPARGGGRGERVEIGLGEAREERDALQQTRGGARVPPELGSSSDPPPRSWRIMPRRERLSNPTRRRSRARRAFSVRAGRDEPPGGARGGRVARAAPTAAASSTRRAARSSRTSGTVDAKSPTRSRARSRPPAIWCRPSPPSERLLLAERVVEHWLPPGHHPRRLHERRIRIDGRRAAARPPTPSWRPAGPSAGR